MIEGAREREREEREVERGRGRGKKSVGFWDFANGDFGLKLFAIGHAGDTRSRYQHLTSLSCADSTHTLRMSL